jgi:hypothetical protein
MMKKHFLAILLAVFSACQKFQVEPDVALPLLDVKIGAQVMLSQINRNLNAHIPAICPEKKCLTVTYPVRFDLSVLSTRELVEFDLVLPKSTFINPTTIQSVQLDMRVNKTFALPFNIVISGLNTQKENVLNIEVENITAADTSQTISTTLTANNLDILLDSVSTIRISLYIPSEDLQVTINETDQIEIALKMLVKTYKTV